MDKLPEIPLINEETDKKIGEMSEQKIIEFIKNGGGRLVWVMPGSGERELTVNSQGELCYIEEMGAGRSIKLLKNFKAKQLTEESKRELAEYLRQTELATPIISQAVTMTKLAAAIAINSSVRKNVIKMGRSHTIVTQYIYDPKKENSENARKIYVLVCNSIFSRECNNYLEEGGYDEIKCEVEVPSQNSLAEQLRYQFETNPEVNMKFEFAKKKGCVLLVVSRKRKDLNIVND